MTTLSSGLIMRMKDIEIVLHLYSAANQSPPEERKLFRGVFISRVRCRTPDKRKVKSATGCGFERRIDSYAKE